MPTGRVKWFADARGFGFIVNDAGWPELFVHCTGIDDGGGHRSLHADARVAFNVPAGRKGLEAYDVRPTAPPRPAPAVAGARPVPQALRCPAGTAHDD